MSLVPPGAAACASKKGAGCGVRFIYLTSIPAAEQPESGGGRRQAGHHRVAATIINGMRPQTIGRVLGHGCASPAKWLASGFGCSAAPQPRSKSCTESSPTRAVQFSRAVTPGGQEDRSRPAVVLLADRWLLRPFKRVGSILWLEVTGVFFLLPVLVFCSEPWRMRASWAHGPDTPNATRSPWWSRGGR